MLIAEATSRGQAIMLLGLCKENLGTEIGMIRKSRPPFKTTLSQMMVERKRTLTQKFIVLKAFLLLLT
jgi:hypothetical protein